LYVLYISAYLTGLLVGLSFCLEFKEFDERYVAFGGRAKGGKITGKGIIKTGKLDFEDVYFVNELQFNPFSVSQMCDKKKSGDGPKWLFDIDDLTELMNYIPVIADSDNKDNDGLCKESKIDNQERIEEKVYVCQFLRFEDPGYPHKVYKELCTKFEKLMHDKFQISSMGELTFFLGLQVKQNSHGIFIIQDKYIDVILRKFKYTDVKPASTTMDKEKALLKDSDGDYVDVHLYRTFRYLKGQPKLGLCYLRDSSIDLVAYTDSDYAGASLERKSTSGGCQFLGCRLIAW
nr:putative ribonuclease H-like domain-containing protein [Tanacetum cinerariifolium]